MRKYKINGKQNSKVKFYNEMAEKKTRGPTTDINQHELLCIEICEKKLHEKLPFNSKKFRIFKM